MELLQVGEAKGDGEILIFTTLLVLLSEVIDFVQCLKSALYCFCVFLLTEDGGYAYFLSFSC